MKKIKHVLAAATLILTVSGCQSIQVLQTDRSQKSFNGPTYLGKELPSAFVTETKDKNVDNGNQFRGFGINRRHWF